MKKGKMDTGGLPEKVLNLMDYQLSLATDLHHDQIISARISKSAAGLISEYFNLYYDSLARTKKYLYQHVYEFDLAGEKSSRLFKQQIKTSGNTSIIKYDFTDAQKPNKNGYVFKNKAYVMENGQRVVIKPKNAKVLAFEANGEMIYTKNPITIRYPGGRAAAGSFNSELSKFMNSAKANRVLVSSGFIKKIEQQIFAESEITEKKLPAKIVNMKPRAKTSATRIANKLPRSEKE